MASRSVTKEKEQPSLHELLDAMSAKRESTRENALASLIHEFDNEDNMQQLDAFVENNVATIIYHCLNSIKKQGSSSQQVYFASRFLGLVALTTIPGGHIARYIRQESISPMSETLSFGSFGLYTYSSLIDSLALITFLGGVQKPEETEEAIKNLSDFIDSYDTHDIPPSIIESLVYAFSLLLTTNDKVPINPEIWRKPICFLLGVLNKEVDAKLWLPAAQALALSFEIPSLIRFICCPQKSDGGDFKRGDLMGKVVNKLEKSSKIDRGDLDMYDEIVGFLDNNEIPEDLLSEYTIKTWGEFLQTRFLKYFNGEANGRSSFRRGTEDVEDECVHDVDVELTDKLNSSFVGLRMTKTEKRLYKSPNSIGSKERTKVINKKRGVVEDSKAGYYTGVDGDEEV